MTNACRPRCTSLARPWRAAIVDRTQDTYTPRSPGGTAVRGPRSAAAARRKLRRAPISADTRPSAPASIPSTAAPGVRKRGCGSITERTFGAPCWRTSILKTLLFAPAGFAQVAGLRRLISKAFRISTSGHTRGRAARRRPRATGPHTAHSSPTQPGRQRPHSCLSTKLSVCLSHLRATSSTAPHSLLLASSPAAHWQLTALRPLTPSAHCSSVISPKG